MTDEMCFCNHCGRELTPGREHHCGPHYRCNCGTGFATPDERTIHSSSCPVMAIYRKVKELETEQDRLNKELSETRECLGRETQRLIHERERYKADWEKLMAAIDPYPTTDIAVKMAEEMRTAPLRKNDFVPLEPPVRDKYGVEHDMKVGPCSCGAVHKLEDAEKRLLE